MQRVICHCRQLVEQVLGKNELRWNREINGISAYTKINISVQRPVQLPKTIPLTEENQEHRMHLTKKPLKSSAVFMFLISLLYFSIFPKQPIEVLALPKQTHVDS